MLPFSVDIQDGVAVSDQIIGSVRKAILKGQLQPGDPFPSVRHMSQELRISPTTAHKVVTHLKDRGLLASRPGVGMVVAPSVNPNKADLFNHLTPSIQALLQEAAELGLDSQDVIRAIRRQAQTDHKPSPKS